MRRVRADGDTWSVRLGRRSPSSDTRVVLFFCETTSQRPYRVVEVPAERVSDAAALEAVSTEELREWFRASRSMDFPHDLHTTTGAR